MNKKGIKLIYKKILLLTITILFIFGCSSKDLEKEYNKPATYWYNKMLKNISESRLEKADDILTSLQSEHRNSPLLPSALMIIADAHMQEEEYELANYYYDTYIKRYENKSLQSYVRYLKIKSKFMAFKQHFREQKLIDDTLLEINTFLYNYPESPYIQLVKTMQTRLYMSKANLNVEIADLYKRKDKPKAYEFYMQKAKKSWSNTKIIEPVSVPWYRALFE